MRQWIPWMFIVGFAVQTASTNAQVVQLPTTQQFTVNTTVSVPDGGMAFLGGIQSARSNVSSNSVPGLGRLPFAGRLFRNRSIGRDAMSSRAFVKASIIDLQELDAAILGQAAAQRARANQPIVIDPIQERAVFLTKHVGRTSRNPNRIATANPMLGSQIRANGKQPTTPSAARTAKQTEPPLILKRK